VRRTISLLLLSLVTASTTLASAADSADECVGIGRTQTSTGLDFEVRNGCDKTLSCSLGWTLSCESGAGKVTSSTRAGAQFVISSGDTHQAAGSAAACNGNWRIADVTWSCAPAK
jgi:hypothetical protein